MKSLISTSESGNGQVKKRDKVNGKLGANGDGNLPLTEEAPREGRLEASPILRLQVDLYDLAKKRAVDSRALQPVERDIRSLEDHARAMARETYREVFDPQRFLHDRLREEEYKKLLRDREEAETALKFAQAVVRECEEELAKLQAGLEPPEQQRLMMIAVLVVIAATVSPTLHDFVYSSIEDDLIAWFLSLATGGFLGALISWGILGSVGATGKRTGANWAGLAAGLTITVGLGVFRFSGIQDTGEGLMALALTLVEAGVVILAEWVATGLREKYRIWSGRHEAASQAEARRNAVRAEAQRRQEALDRIEGRISDFINHVEERQLRHLSVSHLEEVAVKAVHDGFNAGIAENRSRII